MSQLGNSDVGQVWLILLGLFIELWSAGRSIVADQPRLALVGRTAQLCSIWSLTFLQLILGLSL